MRTVLSRQRVTLLSSFCLAALLFMVNSSQVIKAQEPTFEPPALKPSQTTPLWYTDPLLPAQFDWRDYGVVTEVREGPRANPSDPNFPIPSYVTAPKSQGSCGSCYAFGAIGSVEALLGRKGVGALDLSENNAKNCNASKQANPGTCGESGNFPMVVNLLNQKGTVLESADPYVATSSPTTCKTDVTYQQTVLSWVKIGTWKQLADKTTLKNYLVNYGPINISIKADNQGATGQRFMNYDGVTPIYMPLALSDGTDHAVLLVGWNDNKAHEGGQGVWIIKNSWGTTWGQQGYGEVAYGSANIAMGYSYIPTDFQPYNSTGNVILYDTMGTGGKFYTSGLGTDGMVKFTPPQDSCVDRVELQLFGATKNINTTIYDELGTNPLVSVKDASWPSGGNVSIPVPGTVRLKANDDVYVAVNLSDNTLSADASTSNTGRSYLSYDNGKSWESSEYTLNIRLRTKSCTASDPVAPTATPTAFVPTATHTPLPTVAATNTPQPATATATSEPAIPTATTPPDQPTPTPQPTATAMPVTNAVASVCYDLTSIPQKRAASAQPIALNPVPWKFERFLPRQDELQQQHQQQARAMSQPATQRGVRQTPPPYSTGKTEEENDPNVIGRIMLPNGQPAAFAEVTIYLLDNEGFPYSDALANVATDELGNFGVYLEDGNYSLEVVPHYTDAETSGVTRLTSLHFRIAPPITLNDLGELILPQAPKRIQGKVQDINGNPVSQVHIDIYNEDTQEWLWFAPKADGTFDFAVGGGTWELTLYPDANTDWVLVEGTAQVIFENDNTSETQGNIVLTVQKAEAAITGQLVDSAGQPLSILTDTIQVGVWNEAGIYIYRFVQTDGKFSLPVMNGVYQPEIWVENPENYPQFSIPNLDSVEVNGNTDLGQIKLSANDSLIIGRVTSADNQPVEGIFIDALQTNGTRKNGYTDAEGYYTMTVPAGDWQVAPHVADYEAYLYTGSGQEVTTTPNQPATANFSLEPIAGYLYGQVVNEQNQRVADLSAYAYLRRANDTQPLLTAPVENGEFYVKLPFGDLKVGLYLDGNSGYTFLNEVAPSRAALTAVELAQHELAINEQAISAAQANQDKTVTLQVKSNNAHIKGKLIDEDGVTLQNAWGVVMAELEGTGQVWQWTYLNDDGSYDLAVTPGTWNVSYELNETGYAAHPTTSTPVVVAAGQTVQQNLNLITLDNMVSGKVVNAAGAPQVNIAVWVHSDNYETFVTTDEQGIFTAYLPRSTKQATMQVGTAVATCNANVEATACLIDALAQETQPVGRLAPRQTGVNLVLRNGDTYLVGQVLNGMNNNAPLPGALVSGYNTVGGQSVQMTSDNNGCFAAPIDKTDSYNWQLQATSQYQQGTWTYGLQTAYTLAGNTYNSAIKRDGTAVSGLSTNSALVLQNSGTLPENQFATFNVSQGWKYTLKDGTMIQIPPNAVNTREQQVQVYITLVKNLPLTYLYSPLNYGYKISLYESNSGREITNNLSKNIALTFRYDQSVNRDRATSDSLVTGYLANNVWQANYNFTRDKVAREITMQTDKTGTFALLTPNTLTLASSGKKTYLPLIVK